MSPKYRWTGITLKDLRLGATPDGQPTRPIHKDEEKGEVKFTQAWVAERLHISQQHYANIETGRHRAPAHLLASMRTLFSVPLPVVYAAAATTAATVRPTRPRRPA